MLYKGTITMNDGTKMPFPMKKSKADVLSAAREMLNSKIRYYKKNGVDYGAGGKLFTYEEEHGGLKELVIIEYSETNRETMTEI